MSFWEVKYFHGGRAGGSSAVRRVVVAAAAAIIADEEVILLTEARVEEAGGGGSVTHGVCRQRQPHNNTETCPRPTKTLTLTSGNRS